MRPSKKFALWILAIGLASIVVLALTTKEGDWERIALPKKLAPKSKIQVPILLYHHIGEHQNVSPQNFQAQLSWLNEHNYQTITPDELIQILNQKLVLAKNQ